MSYIERRNSSRESREESTYKLENDPKMRTYFAGKALVGLLSNSKYNHLSPIEIAAIAYQIANAMIIQK